MGSLGARWAPPTHARRRCLRVSAAPSTPARLQHVTAGAQGVWRTAAAAFGSAAASSTRAPPRVHASRPLRLACSAPAAPITPARLQHVTAGAQGVCLTAAAPAARKRAHTLAPCHNSQHMLTERVRSAATERRHPPRGPTRSSKQNSPASGVFWRGRLGRVDGSGVAKGSPHGRRARALPNRPRVCRWNAVQLHT